MSTKRRSRARTHPTVDRAPRTGAARSDNPAPTGGIAALMESAAQEILVVTHWFDPATHSGPYPVTVRFSGRRLDMEGRPQSGDRFTHDETIDEVIPGSGPISVTARIRNINPGEWDVTAQSLESRRSGGRRREPGSDAPTAGSLQPVARIWRRWAPPVDSATATRTCLAPFARVPGVLPGVWAVLVVLGMVFALAIQALVISRDHLAVGPTWTVSLIAIAVGIASAKAWFYILHRRDHRMEGWCIQGFMVGASVAAAVVLLTLGVPAGAFLDATAPGLLIGLALGRVGCFFAGCCGGPLTASRWGIWSSDQRVGARRVPTQLLESLFALIVGLVALRAVLDHGPARGAFFVAALAAYTLGRQGILRLRLEPRRTTIGGPVIAVLAALALLGSVVVIVR